MDGFKIIVSTRMKNNPVARYLEELGTDVRYITLRRGEFLLADKYGITYYSREQFTDSIKRRTIYRDVLELKREYENPMIIVEGDEPFSNNGIALPTVHGALLFISVLNQIPILYTADETDTAQMIFMLSAQTTSAIDWKIAMAARESSASEGRQGQDIGDPRVGIIGLLPDVGPALAEGLLNHFGSLSKLFAADVKDLKRVEGIGPKRAEKIFAFLNGIEAA